MADDPDTLMLVSTIVALTRSLRLNVVAEGVETEDQAKIPRLLRFRMQGYMISKPVPESEVQEILRRTSP